MIRTVGELIDALSRFERGAIVLGTWESTIRELDVYSTPSGVVLVDADHSDYREEFESGKTVPTVPFDVSLEPERDHAEVTLYGKERI